MNASVAGVREEGSGHAINRIHALLTIQSVVVVLLSINRLSSLTLGYVAPNEFLRWVDFNNMLVLPLISLVAFYLLKKQLERNPRAAAAAWQLGLGVVFIVGVYLLGASYGDHEVTNYLHARFCPAEDTGALCSIIRYNDDEFSHYLFFIGFVLVNASLLLLQVAFPHPALLTTRDKILLVVNGVFIAAGIFANLAFEQIGLDLIVVAILAALSLWLLWRRGAQPLVIYYSTAFSIGLVATAIYKALGR